MVFNSFEFLLVFLPLCYLGFLLVHAVAGWRGVYPYLALASLVFYAQWSIGLAAILLGSVLCNFAAANLIIARRAAGQPTRLLLGAAVTANLLALGYLKYANFLIDVVNTVAGPELSHLALLMPIGVSFYTFIQIGYLVEAHNGQAVRPSFGRYALFATFFPYVTAGPLVLQREMAEQMKDRDEPAFCGWRMSVGLTLFGMGLFKKVVLADTIAPYADAAFNGVAAGAVIGPVDAWAGALCYTLQLYFDFSGYSDMAIGLGYLFGLKLPLNFDSPLKATSITDFWRRWHMTMTRFFNSYLYTPLAMKMTRKAVTRRFGRGQRYLATIAYPVTYTFVIAGIWHGAGWNFVVYGLIHGVALAVNRGWREFGLPQVGPAAGWLLTMATVVSALVVFRAPDLASAAAMLGSMWGVGTLAGWAPAVTPVVPHIAWAGALIVVLGTIVLAFPNTQEILRGHWVSSDPQTEARRSWLPLLQWNPNLAWGAVAAATLVIGVTSVGADSGFLYYRF